MQQPSDDIHYEYTFMLTQHKFIWYYKKNLIVFKKKLISNRKMIVLTLNIKK